MRCPSWWFHLAGHPLLALCFSLVLLGLAGAAAAQHPLDVLDQAREATPHTPGVWQANVLGDVNLVLTGSARIFRSEDVREGVPEMIRRMLPEGVPPEMVERIMQQGLPSELEQHLEDDFGLRIQLREPQRQYFSSQTDATPGALIEASFDAAPEGRTRLLRTDSGPNVVSFGLRVVEDGEERTLRATSGSITVVRYTGGLEAYFRVELEETVPGGREPLRASVEGRLCQVADEGLAWGDVPCLAAPELIVEETRPANRRENVLTDRPPLYAVFSQPISPFGPLAEAVTLRTRSRSGADLEVEVNVRLEDDYTLLIEPQEELLSGVIYEVRLRGGADGLRAESGARLPMDHTWRFSTVLDLNDPAMRAAPMAFSVYQTIRDAPLVHGKPTATRIALDWRERLDVRPEWQPETFPMTIHYSRDFHSVYDHFGIQRPRHPDGTYSEGVRIRRPDYERHPQHGFSVEDRRLARNTVNVMGWRPEPSDGPSVTVRIEPSDPYPEDGEPPAPLAQNHPAPYQAQEPRRLSIRYALLQYGRWGDGIPDEVMDFVPQVIRETQTFATQALPVVRTTMTPMPGSGVYVQESQEENRRDLELIRLGRQIHDEMMPYTASTDVLLLLYDLETFVSAGLALSAVGWTQEYEPEIRDIWADYRNGTVAFYLDPAHPSDVFAQGIVHELGHAYGLRHAPNDANADSEGACSHLRKDEFEEIDGFRITTAGDYGWNKSTEEGNAEDEELLSMMWPCVERARKAWFTVDEYQSIDNRMPGRLSSAAHSAPELLLADASRSGERLHDGLTASPYRAPGETLFVTGRIHPEGGEGALDQVTHTTRVLDDEPGPYTAELLDASGAVLSSASFDLFLGTEGYREWLASEAIDPADPTWWPLFRVSLPRDAAGERIVVRRGETVLAERGRSPSPPTLSVDQPSGGLVLEGPTLIRWTASANAAAALPVATTLLYSPTGEAPWQVLVLRSEDASATVDTDDLEPGPSPTLRAIASDGFDETRRDVPVTLRREPLPRWYTPDGEAAPPREGAPPSVTASFDTDLDPASLAGRFTLTDGQDERVEGRVVYDPQGRIALFAPTAPLAPDASYTATLAPGIEDRYGNRLERVVTWTFRTPDAEPLADPTSFFERAD